MYDAPRGNFRLALLRIARNFCRPLVGWGLLRIGPLAWLYSTVYWKLARGEAVARVHGYSMRVNLGFGDCDKQLFMTGRYEPGVTMLLQRILAAGMVFVDVGAYIGYYCLVAAKAVGPEGRVYAFEPGRITFDLLLRNVTDNRLDQVVPMRVAISRREGTEHLLITRDRARQRFVTGDRDTDALSVSTTTLDRFFSERDPRVDVIKMDIEGAEAWALEGMSRLLSLNPHIRVISELNPSALEALGVSPDDYLRALTDRGFALFRIGERDGGLTNVTGRPAEAVLSGERWVNLYCERRPT